MRILLLLIIIGAISCRPTPVDIEYHLDECVYCKMKISDPNFGAELVTTKGKVHKYDSAECLLSDYPKLQPSEYAFVLVTDYIQPFTLIDATKATYLVSVNLPSPMGGNLSAYEDRNEAEKIQKIKGGQLYDFEQILLQSKELHR